MENDFIRFFFKYYKSRNRIFWLQALLLAGVILYLGGVHISLLKAPISRDAGAFMTMATEIHKGNLPYADYVDHKPPGIYYFLAVVFIFSESAIAGKVSILIVNFVTAGLIALVGRRVWTSITGIVAAGLYLAALPLYSGYHVLTGQLVALTSVGAMYLFIKYRTTNMRCWLIAAGLSAGCVPLFKQPGLVTPALFFAVLVLNEAPEFRIKGIRRIWWFSLVAVVPIIVVFVLFVIAGAGREFIFWTLTVNIEYSGIFTIDEIINRHIASINDFRVLWYLGGLGTLIALLRATRTRRIDSPQIIALLLIVSGIPLLLGPYAHYLIQPLPFAALSVGYMISELKSAINQTFSINYALPLLLMGLFILSLPVVGAIADTESQINEFGLDDQEKLAGSVAGETDDGQLLVITAEPAMYFLTGHHPYDENLYYLPANQGISFTEKGIVSQLQTDSPKYVLTRQCHRVKNICDYVRTEYERIDDYERGFTLYRLN